MAAAQSRLDIAAENLANVSSAGYARRAATGFLTPHGVAIRSQATEQRVDPVAEMVDVLGAQRAFESAAKVATTVDAARKEAADAGRVR